MLWVAGPGRAETASDSESGTPATMLTLEATEIYQVVALFDFIRTLPLFYQILLSSV